MKLWLKSHLGLLIAVPVLVMLMRFPLNPNEALPNPLEAMFDWGGEGVAMVWIGSAVFASDFGLAFVLAAILDRCPAWHGIIAITIFCVGYILFFTSSYPPIARLAVAILDTIYLSIAYVGIRLIVSRAIRKAI